jgi:hypothetical protein
MKTSHQHSTFGRFLSAFFAFTFIGHGVSSLGQTKSVPYGEKTSFIIAKIDGAVALVFQEAWHLSRNGTDGFEGLVLVYPMHNGSILARSQGKSNEQKHFAFRWPANTIAVVHTHPNGVDPKPTGDDLRLADRFGVPVFTITQRGMYVYDPDTKKISMVQEGLDWLESTIWNQRVVAKKR